MSANKIVHKQQKYIEKYANRIFYQKLRFFEDKQISTMTKNNWIPIDVNVTLLLTFIYL